VSRVLREHARESLCVTISLPKIVAPVLLRHVVDDRFEDVADLVSLLGDPIAHLRVLRVTPSWIEHADFEENLVSERGVRSVREARKDSPMGVSPLDALLRESRASLVSAVMECPRRTSSLDSSYLLAEGRRGPTPERNKE